MKSILEYYKTPGTITDLSKYNAFWEKITSNPEYICRIAAGIFIHDCSTSFFKVEYSEDKLFHPLLMSDLMEALIRTDDNYLTRVRDAEKRLLVCCREYSVFTVSLLRAKGIPARSRCVFAIYVNVAEGMEDHWIVEYWNGERWVAIDPMVDPMFLSAFQRKGVIRINGIDKKTVSNYGFPNPSDLAQHEYILMGEAWKYLRENIVSEEQFSYLDLKGKHYVRMQLLRDFSALNKFEFQTHFALVNQGYSWDSWRLMTVPDEELTSLDLELLDKIAELTLDVDKNFKDITYLYDTTPSLHMPDDLVKATRRKYISGMPQQVLVEILKEDEKLHQDLFEKGKRSHE